jgi:hypothetical protein
VEPEKKRKYGTSLPETPATVILNQPSAYEVLVEANAGEERFASEPESVVTCSLAECVPVLARELEIVAVPVPDTWGLSLQNPPFSKLVATTAVPG